MITFNGHQSKVKNQNHFKNVELRLKSKKVKVKNSWSFVYLELRLNNIERMELPSPILLYNKLKIKYILPLIILMQRFHILIIIHHPKLVPNFPNQLSNQLYHNTHLLRKKTRPLYFFNIENIFILNPYFTFTWRIINLINYLTFVISKDFT